MTQDMTHRSAELTRCDVTWDWVNLSAMPAAAPAWAHSGLVVTAAGQLVGFHAGNLVFIGPDGQITRVVATELVEGHGITVVREGEQEFLWICDTGLALVRGPGEGDEELATMFGIGKGLDRVSGRPRVVKMTLDGEIVLELASPPADPRAAQSPLGSYGPCGTAVDEERLGGSGDVWVADGYGSSLVHRFNSRGDHVATLSGEEGGGRFSGPHALLIRRREGEDPQLYIADRGNHRVQVYDLDGRHLRTFGEDVLNSPSGFTWWGDFLVVAELYGRVAVLDDADELVGYIGADPDCVVEGGRPSRSGWPNALSPEGRAEAPPARAGCFTAPHSVAVDAEGNLYVSEYIIGGRYAKVTPLR